MRRSQLRVFLYSLIVATTVAVAGCGGSPPAPSSPERSASTGKVRQALYRQLEEWRGTRYRMGGMSKRGIDCSGLTTVVYRDLFGAELPRTTDAQADVGRSVHRRELAPGDLVFFKTGFFQKHVGIYVGGGKFLHASKSSGVRLSRLSAGYWDDRYWQARRLAI